MDVKKLFLSLVVICAFIQSLSAQKERVAGKLFYTELGGPGVLMSASFDARFKFKERLGFGYRLGAGFGVGDVRTVWVDKQWG